MKFSEQRFLNYMAEIEKRIYLKGTKMEFIQINKKRVLVYAESEKHESEIRKLIERLIETIKQIQAELK